MVSVIIPAYNVGVYIDDAVSSVLSQTYDNLECIVVDDGSTDDTAMRLARYGDRIVCIRQENEGRTAARRRAIDLAVGDFLAFLDADDYWAPEKLEKQLALFAHDPMLGVVGCGGYLVDTAGTPIRELSAAPSPTLPRGDVGLARLLALEYGIAAPLSTLLIRRRCYDEVGGFDLSINTMEEWDLLLRIILNWNIACVMEPLAYYRGYGYFTASKVAPRRRQDWYIDIVERTLSRLGSEGLSVESACRARALAYLRGALIDFAVGQVVNGRRRMASAAEAYPPLFSDVGGGFVDAVAYFSVSLYDVVTPFSMSLAYINDVTWNLPSVTHNTESLRAAASQLAWEIAVFDAHQRDDSDSLRCLARFALLHNPSLFKNRGALSLILQSQFGVRPIAALHRLLSSNRRRFLSPDV